MAANLRERSRRGRLVDRHWDARPAALGGRSARRGFTYRAYVPEKIADDDFLLSSHIAGTEERARQAVLRLERAGVLRQTAIRRRNRAWECVGLFDLLDRFERELGPATRTPQPTC
ncbi:MAG: hypothetical protein KJ051_00045 [Thermoleophilia bacterium]|nr:hypothetical protein [Thermoleophilia bacterium]